MCEFGHDAGLTESSRLVVHRGNMELLNVGAFCRSARACWLGDYERRLIGLGYQPLIFSGSFGDWLARREANR